MVPKAWSVYILLCADGSYYTGITTDPKRRVAEHNGEGPGARYTRGRRPVHLVYLESCPDRSSASRREAAIKALRRTQKVQLVRRAGIAYALGSPAEEATR